MAPEYKLDLSVHEERVCAQFLAAVAQAEGPEARGASCWARAQSADTLGPRQHKEAYLTVP